MRRILPVIILLAGCYDEAIPVILLPERDQEIASVQDLDPGHDVQDQYDQVFNPPIQDALLWDSAIDAASCLEEDPCNCLDDDCDGLVDEDLPPGVFSSCLDGQGASPCNTGLEGHCRAGRLACGEDSSIVCQPVFSTIDLPDYPGGEDEDCDGLVDETPILNHDWTCRDNPDYICIPGGSLYHVGGYDRYPPFRALRREFSIQDLPPDFRYVTRHHHCQHPDCPLELIPLSMILVLLNEMSVQEGLTVCYNIPGLWRQQLWDALGRPPYRLGHPEWTALVYHLLRGDIRHNLDCTGYRLPTLTEYLVMSTAPNGRLTYEYRPTEAICDSRVYRQSDLPPNYVGMTAVIDNLAEFYIDINLRDLRIKNDDIKVMGRAYTDKELPIGWAERPSGAAFCHNQGRSITTRQGDVLLDWGFLGVGFRPVRAE